MRPHELGKKMKASKGMLKMNALNSRKKRKER